jgi:flagellar motor switch/type III secretory pathway protein FliN
LQQAGEDPVEVFVDGQLAGRGEILLREGRFCVRLTEVTTHRPISESDAEWD